MWMCFYCGEAGTPDKHKCEERILQAVKYGRTLERSKKKMPKLLPCGHPKA